MIGGNIVNILGNWVLIYGVAGFPELGLLGAGISTLASRILMALAMAGMVVTCRKFRTYSYDIVHSCVNRKDFKEMNRLGWPVALQLGMESAAFTLSCVMVGWLGTNYAIASGSYSSVQSGETYTLNAYGTASGTPFTVTPISRTCP